MEIKKGISQMAEYPNVEINYVMPKDGRMYYVLKEGILDNGCIIATLDPKYAIDEQNPSTSVGVFSEAGEVLIDFDKKSIKQISNDLVLVLNAKLNTPEVIGVAGMQDDAMISRSVDLSKETILNQMKEDIGPNGEMIFSDPYQEANIYRLDSYNHKLGNDCSFIGKNNDGLFFHTNDAKSETQFIEVDDFKVAEEVVVEPTQPVEQEDEIKDKPSNSTELDIDVDNNVLSGFDIPEEDLEKVNQTEEIVEDNNESEIEEEEEETPEEDTKEEVEENEKDEEEDKQEISLDIEKNIPEDEDKEDDLNDDKIDHNKVLDNAIEVINKMIEETNKLKDRISELEEQLQEKDEIIQTSENKQDELNEILDKANEVLSQIK